MLGFGSLHNAMRAARVMALGALGYIPKDTDLAELVQAIHSVATGLRFIAARYEPKQMQRWLDEPDQRLLDPILLLTRRENQVFELVAQGRTNYEIGRSLQISVRGVEIHRSSMMSKLHLENAAALVRFTLRIAALRADPAGSPPGSAHKARAKSHH